MVIFRNARVANLFRLMTHQRLSQRMGWGTMVVMSHEIHPSDFGTPFATLVQHFESNDFHFNSDRSDKSIQFYITRECAAFSCRFHITRKNEVLALSINFPVTARDPKIRPLVTETLVRINHNLIFGAFDLDVDTGQIGFYAGQVIPTGGLDSRVISGIFDTCMGTCDRYFPALMRVMFGGSTPADAVYLSEIDAHAAELESGENESAPDSGDTKPATKKPRGRRKDKDS